jgi:hypothetical protein
MPHCIALLDEALGYIAGHEACGSPRREIVSHSLKSGAVF